MVDIRREGVGRKKRIRRALYSALAISLLLGATWAFSSLEPAAPSVERASVWIGEVERGPLAIEVRGTGTLVPEEVRWVAASTGGRVERIAVLPGSEVAADTVLAELNNPSLERETLDAELALKKALAELDNLQVEIETESLTRETEAAVVRADYLQNQLQVEHKQALSAEQLISNLDLELSQIAAQESARRYELSQRRLEMNPRAREARIAAKKAEIEQLEGMYNLRRQEVDLLKVRAGIAGVLQETPVEVGRQVTAGEILGKVAVPSRLRAELRISETQVRDIRVGLLASIDTRNGVVAGRVTRIDPAAREGTVTVDIAFSEKLPGGVRPDQNIDGTIRIDYLEDVLKIDRPVSAQEDAAISLFKINEGHTEAIRVPVRLGKTSVTTVQIVKGLKEGDRVILSDTHEFDDFDRIRLN